MDKNHPINVGELEVIKNVVQYCSFLLMVFMSINN